MTGFYHIALMNHWRDVVREQVAMFQRHLPGVPLVVNVAGEGDIELPYPVAQRTGLYLFEFPTLHLLWRHCREHEDRVFYIHTKGVCHDPRHNGDPWLLDIPARRLHRNEGQWRAYMMHFVVRGWRRCQQALDDHDLCGVNWDQEAGRFHGNFWWARSDYIARLPEPVPHQDRGQAELWVGQGGPRVKELFHADRDLYREGIPKTLYQKPAFPIHL